MPLPEELDRCLVEVSGRFVGLVTREDRGAVFTAFVPEARSLDGTRYRSLKAAARAVERTLRSRHTRSDHG
jgi:hypothetical protein